MQLSTGPSENSGLYYDLENLEDNNIREILQNLSNGKPMRFGFGNGNGFEIKSTTGEKENIISINYFGEKLNYDILQYLFLTFNNCLPNQETGTYKYGLSNFDNKIPGSVQLASRGINTSSINFLLGVFKKFGERNKILIPK